MNRLSHTFAFIVIAVFYSATAHAAVTVEAWYRGGETDAGAPVAPVSTTPIIAASGTDPGAMTDNSGNGFDLDPSNNGAAPGPYWVSPGIGGAGGSTHAYGFDPGGQNHGVRTAGPVTTATDNFGIEAWLLASTDAGQAAAIYNGVLDVSGYGLYRFGGNVSALYRDTGATTNVFASTSITPNEWLHVAFVVENGVGTLYANGVDVGSGAVNPIEAPTTLITLGTDTGGNFWGGNIDEARVFTFIAGEFDPQTDLLYPNVPEPASIALVALGGVLMLCRRRN